MGTSTAARCLSGILAVASLFATTAYGADVKMTNAQIAMDEVDVVSQCNASKQVLADLIKSGKLTVSKESADSVSVDDKLKLFNCAEVTRQMYAPLCDASPYICENYVLRGMIYWLVGVELNIPVLRLPFIKGSRFETRVAIGISSINTMEAGTGRTKTTYSVVALPAVGTVFEKKVVFSADSVPESDALQIILGGLTKIYVPKSEEAKTTLDDLFVSRNNILQLESLKKIYINGQGEVRSPISSEIFQRSSLQGSIGANVNGVVSTIGSAVGLDLVSHADNVIMLTGTHTIGKIRKQNASVQLNGVIEIVRLN